VHGQRGLADAGRTRHRRHHHGGRSVNGPVQNLVEALQGPGAAREAIDIGRQLGRHHPAPPSPGLIRVTRRLTGPGQVVELISLVTVQSERVGEQPHCLRPGLGDPPSLKIANVSSTDTGTTGQLLLRNSDPAPMLTHGPPERPPAWCRHVVVWIRCRPASHGPTPGPPWRAR
jgi:hypothetical protein